MWKCTELLTVIVIAIVIVIECANKIKVLHELSCNKFREIMAAEYFIADINDLNNKRS